MSHAIVMADASNEASLICAGTTKLKKRLLMQSRASNHIATRKFL